MGLNFYAGCHRCRTKQFFFRGDESKQMHQFWRKHAECIRADKDACVVQGDGYGEQDWMTKYADDEPEVDTANASLDRPAASAGTVGGVVVPGVGPVFVCESCLRGEHQSYGCDHRTGPEDRRDCKNLSADGQRQCLCNPDWPELTKAIRRHNMKVEADR